MRALLACILLAIATATCAQAATLSAVRAITTADNTRLIIELSEPVEHRIERQMRDPVYGVPDRVAIDFPATRVAPGAKIPNGFAEGPALRLRATRTESGAARLLVDVPGLSDVGTFFLPDPYRLIVDLRGTVRRRAPQAPAASPTAAVSGTEKPRGRGAELPPLARVEPLPRLGGAAPRAVRQQPAKKLKVVIDPGHGGKDSGALGPGGIAEKDVVLAIAKRLRDRLRVRPNLEVVLTRDSDVFVRLEERTARANAERADLFISIHANASTNPDASGAETYYLNNTDDRATLRLAAMENGLKGVTGARGDGGDVALILSDLIQNYKIEESVALAQVMQRSLVEELQAKRTPTKDLGVKRGPFYVLVGAGMPGVLVEVSFITHPQEGERLADSDYQDAIASGLLRGLDQAIENTRMTGGL